MAKQKSILPISGKLGETVFVDGKQGSSVRAAPEAGSKKDEPALKEQYSRTRYLNRLAGGINSVVDKYAGNLKVSNFYNLLNKHFRKEPLDNRFLLLKQVEGMGGKYTVCNA